MKESTEKPFYGFLPEAITFSRNIEAFIEANEDDDEILSKYQNFANDIATRIIAKSNTTDFNLDDAMKAIKHIEKTPDFNGNPLGISIDSNLAQATIKIATPSRIFEHMLKKGHSSNTKIVIGGVTLTIEEASMFYECLEETNTELAFCYQNHGTVNVGNDYFYELGFNPFQKPKQ